MSDTDSGGFSAEPSALPDQMEDIPAVEWDASGRVFGGNSEGTSGFSEGKSPFPYCKSAADVYCLTR
jgi:hypothetical protein